MSSWPLLLVIAQSSGQILLVSLTGYVCARTGLITPAVQKGLSQLTVKVLMPCLLFSQVAAGIDLETLLRLWPIPAFMCLYSMFGALFGFAGGKTLRLTKPQTNFATTGIIFNNLTSLSIGLLTNMSNSEAMQILSQKEGESPSETAARGISYTLLATLVGNILRWSIGPYLLRSGNEEHVRCEEPISAVEQGGITKDVNDSCIDSKYLAFETIDETTPFIVRTTRIDRLRESITKMIFSIRQFMNPPLYAALLALIVGTIPQLKNLFFGHNALLYLTITRTMVQLGNITVPTTLIALGAQLYNLPRSKGRGLYPTIAYVMSCRFVLMPILGVMVVISTRSLYVHDPMLWFVLILLASGPSAVNCINIAQLTGTFQEEMASLLFFSYIAVAPMLTIIVTVSLSVISIYKDDA